MSNQSDQVPVIISRTGEINGRGSNLYKWVSGLTDEERAHVREETALVVVEDDNPHYLCCGFKKVCFDMGRYRHRNPSPLELLRVFEHADKNGIKLSERAIKEKEKIKEREVLYERTG